MQLWKFAYREPRDRDEGDESKKGETEEMEEPRRAQVSEKWRIEDAPTDPKKIAARIWTGKNDVSKNPRENVQGNTSETAEHKAPGNMRRAADCAGERGEGGGKGDGKRTREE
jgi:hypothetical protein